jgi:hypothetical protein
MPSFAYVLLDARRRIGLRHTQFAAATCGTIRRKLLKIGAQVRLSVRRIKIAMASACPYQAEYHLAYLYLQLSKLVDELAGLLGQRTDVLLGPGAPAVPWSRSIAAWIWRNFAAVGSIQRPRSPTLC